MSAHTSSASRGNSDPDADWRTLTESERAVLLRMLEAPFEGREDILRQLKKARVKTIDTEGSLRFDAAEGYRAERGLNPAVTAHTEDVDGIPIELILLLAQGRLYELDIWKGDLGPIHRPPEPSRLEIVSGG